MQSPAGCARQTLCDVSTSYRFRVRTQHQGGTFPQPQLNRQGVTRSCDALRTLTLQSGERPGQHHVSSSHHTLGRCPAERTSWLSAQEQHAAVTVCLGGLPGSARLNRREGRQAGRPSVAWHWWNMGQTYPCREQLPAHTPQSLPAQVVPRPPSLLPGPGCRLQQDTHGGWNALSLQQISSSHRARFCAPLSA